MFTPCLGDEKLPAKKNNLSRYWISGAVLLRQQPHSILGFGLYHVAKDHGKGFGASVVVALEAVGVDIKDVIQDAVRLRQSL